MESEEPNYHYSCRQWQWCKSNWSQLVECISIRLEGEKCSKKPFSSEYHSKLCWSVQRGFGYTESKGLCDCFNKSRTVSYSIFSNVEQELDHLVREGIIELIQFSNWAVAIFPMAKSDKSVSLW